MLKRLALLTIALPFGTIAVADTCTFKPDDPASCVRFVGCVNNGEAHFFGRALGWDSGALQGLTSSGAKCAGEWTFDPRINSGKGTMTCTDGNKAGFSFFSRDGQVQAFTGVTISEDGDRMSMWTGANLLEYFAQKYPDQPTAGFQCGDAWVTFPDAFGASEY